MSIQFLKKSTLEKLYLDIKLNIDRYKTGNFDDLITSDSCLVSDKLNLDYEALQLIKGDDKNDAKNAQIIDKAFQGLSPHVARDNRLWTYLTHTHLLKYTRERYPLPGEEKGEDRLINHIINHYFTNSPRGFERDNAASRLWWATFMCKRAEHLDLEKSLKAIFLYQDPIVQLLGRPTSAISTNVFNSILEKMIDSMQGDQSFLKDRYSYNRPFMSELSNLGGHKLLDALSPEESIDVLDTIDVKVLSKETKDTVDPEIQAEVVNVKSEDQDDIEVIPKEVATLRDKLVDFDKDIISKKFPNTDENEKILSPVMLMFWLAYLPRNHEEFLSKFRESDRLGIAENERIFIDDICQIIDEHF